MNRHNSHHFMTSYIVVQQLHAETKEGVLLHSVLILSHSHDGYGYRNRGGILNKYIIFLRKKSNCLDRLNLLN